MIAEFAPQTTHPEAGRRVEDSEAGQPLCEVVVDEGAAATVIDIRGELDMSSTSEFAACAAEVAGDVADRHQNLVIDLGKVDFVGSAALSVLAGTAARLESPVHLVVPHIVQRHLGMVGLASRFVCHATLRDALDDLAEGGTPARR